MKEDLIGMAGKGIVNLKLNITEMTYILNPIGDTKMNGVVERYMDDETTRLMCFFIKNKFDPSNPCCKACARRKLCERDAAKMICFKGSIPWLLDNDIEDLIDKTLGPRRCRGCDI